MAHCPEIPARSPKNATTCILTPADVHYNRVDAVLASTPPPPRHAAHPEPFVRGLPTPSGPRCRLHQSAAPLPRDVLEHDSLPHVPLVVDPRLNPIQENQPTTDFDTH